MYRVTRRVPLLIAAGMLLMLSTAGADDLNSNSQKLVLNTYSPGATGMAGPVTTSKALKAGRMYLVTVRGTYSAYLETLMDGKGGWTVCGDPVLAPRESKVQGEEGQDAEFIFALPVPPGVHCPNMPFTHPNFVISTSGPSGPFVHVDPIGGAPTQVDPHHRYVYEIAGTGQPASFAILDSNTTDNYGSLIIHVHPCGEAADRSSVASGICHR